jgi:SAM-dependent methyltransferase
MNVDPFEQIKQAQKQGWVHFVPLEALTTPAAAKLVRHAGVQAGQRVLDVACGTGVVAITAARAGANVSALDLTPELLARAREHGEVAGVKVDWHEGDVEKLPFQDAEFDVVLSQFGHIFAPRPQVAVSEMLRVLKTGGTIAFTTWPPEEMVGRSFAITSRYMPKPPVEVPPPPMWGDPNVVRERLGTQVTDLVFERDRMLVPALSLQHFRANVERSVGPVRKLVEMLSQSDQGKLAALRKEMDALAAEYLVDNQVRQEYLMTRGRKS